MSHAEFDIDIHQETSPKKPINVVDNNGDPVDLTGANIVWQAKHPNGDIILDKDETGDINITDATAGEFNIKFTATETASLNPREYNHEGRIEINGEQLVTMGGSLDVEKSITVGTI